MHATWGNNIKYTLFGESHGKGVGITIDGLPAGFSIDFDKVALEMLRRRPNESGLTTTRVENDSFEIMSGYFNAHTTGAPLSIFIKNADARSSDYGKQQALMRPGHADYTAHVKFNGYNDYRGGGHFSGRLTAPLVFAGAIAKQLLERHDIVIGSHVQKIGHISEKPFDPVHIDASTLVQLAAMAFPVLDPVQGKKMIEVIKGVQEQSDSIGGIIEAAIIHLPAGLGSPFFDSVESQIAHLLFSIPAVKGVEFGDGFALADSKGSISNDSFTYSQDKVKTTTNFNGGILGGITNGMPLVFRAAFKPTPSIGIQQNTIDIQSESNTLLQINGRHDPCIVPRAIPVVEAVSAIAVLDMLLERRKEYFE